MVNCINLIIEMSPRFVLGRENVPCVAEVVNRSLKADCTDFTVNVYELVRFKISSVVHGGHNITESAIFLVSRYALFCLLVFSCFDYYCNIFSCILNSFNSYIVEILKFSQAQECLEVLSLELEFCSRS